MTNIQPHSSLRANAVSAAIHGQAKPVIHDAERHEKVDCFVGLRPSRNDGSEGLLTNRISRIKKLLTPLKPSILEIEDESLAHKGHAGVDGSQEETHLKIRIKADFCDMSLVEKHRKVKSMVKEEFDKGLHALSVEII